MLRSLDSMLGSSIVAIDGEIGKVFNVLFDDRSWAVRYLVVETGSWLTRRKVLLSPAVLARPNWTERTIAVRLTREQVQSSPDIDADQPVSRQQELAMIRHYRWPGYMDAEPGFPQTEAGESGDPHLRSAREVANYQVDAEDGPLGTIADFIIDDDGWEILDLVVDAQSSLNEHKVLVPTRWLSGVSWDDRRVRSRHPRLHSIAADELIEAWRA
ncbi:MAG TPA: PRC-barrel domain-containing protein [Bryobacteraceae bacterium]|jgi:uncharacterized protein YrrD